MTPAPDTIAAPRVTLGLGLMAAAMLMIPMVDGLAKHLSAEYSPLFISWARYGVACVVVLPLVWVKRGGQLFPSSSLGAHTLRTAFLVIAMSLFFLSIARIPLATAITAYFVSPVITVVLSLVVLRERLSYAKLISLCLGVMGTLVILKPGGSIDPGIFLALGAGFFFALYMLATRRAAQTSDPLQTLAFQCAVGAVLLTPQALLFYSAISASDLIFFLGLGILSAISHLMSITAFRFAEATTLAPLVYLELVGAVIIGYLVFGDVPGLSVIAGAVLIVLAGLILLLPRRPA